MRFAWVTDLHLDHAVAAERDRWVSQVASQRYEGLLISGDIAEAMPLFTWDEAATARWYALDVDGTTMTSDDHPPDGDGDGDWDVEMLLGATPL